MCIKSKLQASEYFEAAEICPYCMGENIYPMYDIDRDG